MRSSYWMAAAVVVGATAWVASGQMPGRAETEVEKKPAAIQAAPAPAVRVAESVAENRARRIVLRGRTEPNRQVVIRAETMGRVATIGAGRGSAVAKDTPIIELAEDDRPARLAEARALLTQREVEFRASRTLADRGFRADNQHAVAKAQLDSARALVTRMEVETRRLNIRAPFAGVLESRPVELGDYLKEGDTVATLVDLDPVIVVAHLTEVDRARVAIGQTAVARLATGQEIPVRVRYLSANADSATRTFRIELESPNADGKVIGGVTAEILLAVEQVAAHRITPALLGLDERGVIGVKTVDGGDKVVFQPIRIVDDGPDGMWVTGLPERARIITVGHEFVRAGQNVRPVMEKAGDAGGKAS
ncbi:multidrug efflux system membrane fusion protein [Stella humosa]|uniref:Multidrug efflux system membrane fusion protein n=1 Tax=Stella humosa TaxID=94 RepID=A0A3N1MCE2_9PROT|nr:efflux RND transporter periplasmic adaptor subunit [Stella humosa]ROQ01383.1 multidrug efflux system membrane fusion protein [Stella humosa]BBK31758.1 hemolysin D [Stella humosa]